MEQPNKKERKTESDDEFRHLNQDQDKERKEQTTENKETKDQREERAEGFEEKDNVQEKEDLELEQETGSVLMDILFGSEEFQSSKKRKAGSPETIGRYKRDKRDDQEEPEETEGERDLRKLREVLEILTIKGPVNCENKYRVVNILAELYKGNKSSLYLGSQTSAIDSDSST
ncbi:nucleolar protein 58-like [Diabrotica virgifera virgifera]|uniref:Uncharacterized protein n=1 Tax=Diabrotica virgifera virgifera TaxID=50390 RepID=A0ABM5L500_DIAVI|nr:nucleolar protein 58-like [Diabrotica virgifera virgifera]